MLLLSEASFRHINSLLLISFFPAGARDRDEAAGKPLPGRRKPMSEAKTLPSAARAAMERLNTEAEGLHIWLRTQANAPSQRSWFRDGGLEAGGSIAQGRVGANQMRAAPYRWRWREISPYLDRIAEIARNADVSPIEFADRQQ